MANTEDPESTELEFRGALSALPRPMDAGMVRDCATAAGSMAALGAIALIPYLAGWVELRDADERGLRIVFVLAGLAAAAQFSLRSATPQQMERLHPRTVVPLFLLTPLLVGAAVWSAGPTLGASAVFTVQVPLLAFLVLRRPWAVAATAFSIAVFAAALALLDDPPIPLQQLVLVATSSAGAGSLVGGLAARLDETRTTVLRINARLRRFLAPEVADALIADQDRLAPHRSEIAACFVDLRGFTAFTNASSPDRVVDVLAEYYAVVGAVIDRHSGTIGGFDGDGVFAFVGDPIPHDDVAQDAIAMAREIALALDDRTAEWGLGYGIGLALGEVTVGLVGYEGRLDYTPVGACVNLAARLCSDAASGEIVIDESLRAAAGDRVRPRSEASLKGFGAVTTYSIGP